MFGGFPNYEQFCSCWSNVHDTTIGFARGVPARRVVRRRLEGRRATRTAQTHQSEANQGSPEFELYFECRLFL